MLSKRRKTARCREDKPAQLLQAYENNTLVDRYGDHSLLRWLVIARTYSSGPPGDCPMDAANAFPELLSVDECATMEKQVANRVMSDKQYPKGYLEYATVFFQWWFRIASILSTPTIRLTKENGRCTWLEPEDIEKSLVVPDVRRCAVKVAQELAVRAGEFEVVSAMAGGRTRAVSATLQQLRTEEWRLKAHHSLMYGTIDEIYHAGMLAAVQIAIVDSRFQGRINFGWIKEVLRAPAFETTSIVPWPLIYVHGEHFLVVWRSQHARCSSFSQAFETWRDICMQGGGVIGGRYDVRKCTI